MKKCSKKQRIAFLVTWAVIFIFFNILQIVSPEVEVTLKRVGFAFIASFICAFLVEPEVD
ncbi:MAG: hypothetical protein HFJ43_04310 [Clostridia bacterium]|nr:hypothetical protein [Clostridia bacterium]